MQTLIKNGTLVLMEGCRQGDILIENGVIAALGPELEATDAELYDAAGCLVFPGFIDAHTHLDLDAGACRTSDDFASGSKAALLGGTTTFLDFATQERGHSLAAALAEWHKLADGRCYADYGFHMAITDWNEQTKAELPQLVAQGVSSFKVYMAYDKLRLDDAAIYEICRGLRLAGGLLAVHCENGDLVNMLSARLAAEGRLGPEAHPLSRPSYLEAEAVGRVLAIAQAAEVVPYIVHLSSARGLEVARAARARGQRLWLETCPQYLFLDQALYQQPDFEGAKYVCAPPLRAATDQQALQQALVQGEIDVVATDHCSFHFKGGKDLGRADFRLIPNGLPGIEHRPLLLYSQNIGAGRLTPEQLAACAAETPARIFGLYPRKGVLRTGSDADLTIIRDSAPYAIQAATQAQKVDYTPYEGLELQAKIKAVFLHGELAVKDGKLRKRAPQGRFLQRGPSAGV